MPGTGEVVVYLPAGGHPATAGITRGSAIVGQPKRGADEVTIDFEGAIFGQANMRSLADRAAHAAGRMLEAYPTVARRVVPRDALLAVGTFDLREERITLAGPDSERAVAAWLGTRHLDPAELVRAPRQRPTGADVAALTADISVTVNHSLGEALIERAGIRRDGEENAWFDREGRRTSAIAEALIWALVAIADED